MPFPEVIPHSDGAGIVDAVLMMSPHMLPVTGFMFIMPAGNGPMDQRLNISPPVEQVIPLPAGTSFIHGARLGIPGITAAHAVCCGKSVDGGTVLVSGGGGVVGRYAVQMAKAAGAKLL